MACFVVPVAEAIVTTSAAKLLQKKEKKQLEAVPAETQGNIENKIPFSRKLKWLNNMLWGGSALLCFEHVWHGEVVPYFPFLTAAANSADAAEMLYEMRTVGVCMAVAVTAVWGVMVGVSHVMERKVQETPQASAES